MTAEHQDDQRSDSNRQAIDDLRRNIAEGFSFVRSREITVSVSSITMEESIAQAIVEIEDDRSDIRPGRLSRIRSLKESVLGAIDQALTMPADVFENPEQGSANTEEEGDA